MIKLRNSGVQESSDSNSSHHRVQSKPKWTKTRLSWFVIGLASLLWFLMRTGTKPSRAAYPCQRQAAANAAMWLSAAFVPAVGAAVRRRFPLVLLILVAIVWMTASGRIGFTGLGGAEIASGIGPEPLPLVIQPVVTRGPVVSNLYVVQGTDGSDGGFRRLVALMAEDGLDFLTRDGRGIVGSEDVVIVKVNAQWDSRGGTNTDLVESIIEVILEHPDGFRGEVIIADNGQAQYGSGGRGGSLDWRQNNGIDTSRSMEDVAARFARNAKVSTFLWDTITRNEVAEFEDGDHRDGYILADGPSETGIIVSYPKFTTGYGTKVSFTKGIWEPGEDSYDSDRLTIINVPVLKSHMIYGVTGAVKHYMGVVSDKLSEHTAHRSVGAGGMGTQMAATRVPDLNILDAVWINARPGNGPSTSYDSADFAGIIAAGTDPVALDVWGAGIILVQSAELQGYSGVNRMNPAESGSRSLGSWLTLSLNELNEAGHRFTADPEKIRVVVD